MSFLASLVKPLVYLSLPVILMRSIASSSQTGRYYVRVGMYLGSLTVAAACGAVIGVALSLVGRRYDVNFVVARCADVILGIMDVKVEVEGAEHLETRSAVFICNHQSMLDVVVLAKIFPPRTSIVAKKSIQWTPLGPSSAVVGCGGRENENPRYIAVDVSRRNPNQSRSPQHATVQEGCLLFGSPSWRSHRSHRCRELLEALPSRDFWYRNTQSPR